MRVSRARAIQWAYKKKTGKTFTRDNLDKEEDDEPLPQKVFSFTRNALGE